MNKEQKRKFYHHVVGRALVKTIALDTEIAHESRHETILTIRKLMKGDWKWLMERLEWQTNTCDQMEYCQITADWIAERTVIQLTNDKKEREMNNWRERRKQGTL